MKINAEQAEKIVIDLCQQPNPDGEIELFAIQSCQLSPAGDYWVISANSAKYVLEGQQEHYYVGVSAYLVDSVTGSVEIVGSSRSWQDYLQDKYYECEAGTQHYVLQVMLDKQNKKQLIKLRQWLQCPIEDVIKLSLNTIWFSGPKRLLQQRQYYLNQQAINSVIELTSSTARALIVNNSIFWP